MNWNLRTVPSLVGTNHPPSKTRFEWYLYNVREEIINLKLVRKLNVMSKCSITTYAVL